MTSQVIDHNYYRSQVSGRWIPEFSGSGRVVVRGGGVNNGHDSHPDT